MLPIHRNPQVQRLLALGLLGSLIRWLEILAFGVFTYQQTGSAFWVASMTMLRMLPMGLFGIAFGALAARISRRRGLLVVQGSLLAITLTLLLVSKAGELEIWHLAVASFINGTAWAGDNPMRRGLIGDIAGALHMPRAMALDVVGNSGCRLGGPALGGVLLASGGMEAVLLVTTLLHLTGFVTTLALDESPARRNGSKSGTWSILVGGFQAAREFPRLAATLYMTLVFNIFGWPALSMVPVIGQERLGLSTQGIGVLGSMDGAGALVGAGVVIALARRISHSQVYVGGVAIFLAMLPVVAFSVHPVLTGAALMVIGVGQSGFSIMQATLVFTSVPTERRLEAMGMLTMCIGIAPLGFLAVGWLAGRYGAPAAMATCAIGGLLCLIATWPWWRVGLREFSGAPGRS